MECSCDKLGVGLTWGHRRVVKEPFPIIMGARSVRFGLLSFLLCLAQRSPESQTRVRLCPLEKGSLKLQLDFRN